MSNVIEVPDQSTFWLMNMLKRTIKHEKKVNLDGRYDDAIRKDEDVLRSFFDTIFGRSEAVAQQAAA
jgi:hypothetical protein